MTKKKDKKTVTLPNGHTFDPTLLDPFLPGACVPAGYADSYTVDIENALDISTDYTYSYDQTPKDPLEEAELKLQGICPACREPSNSHAWSCPNADLDLTIDANGGYLNFSTMVEPTITLGTETVDENRLKKINTIVDAIDDEKLDKLIEMIKKL